MEWVFVLGKSSTLSGECGNYVVSDDKMTAERSGLIEIPC